jgi:hypothetical protein
MGAPTNLQITFDHLSTFLKTLTTSHQWKLVTLAVGVMVAGNPIRSHAGRRDVQLVHDYHALVETQQTEPQAWANSPKINPFLSYTNIGTDFGFLGPGMHAMSWDPGAICVGFGGSEWGGVWHSLAGCVTDNQLLDFQRPYPFPIEPKYQPTVTGLRAQVRGTGVFTLELRAPDQLVQWSRRWKLEENKAHQLQSGLDNTPPSKLVNWVAEAGAKLCVDSVAMEMTMPDMTPELEMVLRSYAKFARCYSPGNGLVRDRAHQQAGTFDNLPASGLFGLATAAAADLGLVSQTNAQAILKRVTSIVASIPSRAGVLPHFLKDINGQLRIHPGTEFSVVDTAIYYQAMLIAAEMLHDGPIAGQLVGTMQQIDFSRFRDAAGRVHHGYMENGELIPSVWDDWGGETALVLIQQRLGKLPDLSAHMKSDGAIFRDCGFIPEITSLFFPQFNEDRKEAISGQNWKQLRRALYQRQKSYFTPGVNSQLPPSIFGLSAGEGRFGDTYLVSGSVMPNQRTLHPHYLLMSWASADSTQAVFSTFETLRENHFFPPWGLVENMDAPTGASLPMLGALNASFEFLSIYHAYKAHVQQPNELYAAATRQPELVAAMKLLYP